MPQYRAFVKSRTDLGGKPIANSGTKITSFSISRDLLTKATSTIQLLVNPSAIDIGDVIGVYNEYGKIIYNGVVENISDDSIQCDQMTGIFSDQWLYRTGEGTTLEEKLKEVIDTDWRESDDYVIASSFSPFSIETTSETEGDFPAVELGENETKDFASWLYSVYEDYDIIADIQVPFEDGSTPTIEIGKVNATKVLLADNAISVLSITPSTEIASTNKLVVYTAVGSISNLVSKYNTAVKNEEDTTELNEQITKAVANLNTKLGETTYTWNASAGEVQTSDGTEAELDDENNTIPSELREIWYASPSGWTTDSKQLDRLKKVKTKFVFSDDDIETLKTANLPAEFYNHKIVVELLLDSKLYDFWDFKLGGKFSIYYGKNYYDSILTGYSLSYSGQGLSQVTLTFGKARVNLENKIYKIIHG